MATAAVSASRCVLASSYAPAASAQSSPVCSNRSRSASTAPNSVSVFSFCRSVSNRASLNRSLNRTLAAGKAAGSRSNRRQRNVCVRAIIEEEMDLDGERIADDYYSILGLTPDCTPDEIKRAYYACMKACHPDLFGNHPDSVSFCSFINEVYEVLSDPEMRLVYDEIKGYSLTSVNPFEDGRHERDQVFVDEFTCIGCKNCANTAEATFEIEEMWGRARVCNQSGDPPPKVQEAVETCPVSCIHWVTAPQLALLEDEMRRMERVSVAIMQAQSSRGADVFMQANSRWEKRRMAALNRARVQAAKEQRGRKDDWSKPLWEAMGVGGTAEWRENGTESDGSSSSGSSSVDSAKVRRAAAAARRWREYSRQGVDRRRKLYLSSSDELSASDVSSDESEGAGQEGRKREPVAL